MNDKLKKGLKISSWVVIGIIMLLAIALFGVKLFGLDVYTVLSPSMEPKYMTGSVIYVKDIDPAKLEVHDVITFRISDSMTATHRIIELVPDEDDSTIIRYRTKGDNNNIADGALVEKDAVLGKPVFTIPLLGYLANYMQSSSGRIVTICVALALIAYVSIVDMITDDKKKKENNNDKGVSGS